MAMPPLALAPPPDPRDAEIVALRSSGLTLAEVGREVGLSRERIRQIVARAAEARDHPETDWLAERQRALAEERVALGQIRV